jgi:hypothetical protein
VPPVDEEPTKETAILACARCREALDAKRLPRETDDFRFLAGTIWSEVPPVQLASVRLLRQFAEGDVSWAIEANEGLWLDEATEQKV